MTNPPTPSTAFVSSKGGSGCSTVAACYALRLSATKPGPVHLVSHDPREMRRLLGVDAPVDPDFTFDVSPGLTIGPFGTHVPDAAIVADAGLEATLAAGYDRAFLVLRPCYLALCRAVDMAWLPDGIVLMEEEGRALTGKDIEEALGAPIVARVPHDPAVARAIDSGLMTARLPMVAKFLVRDIDTAAVPA